MGRSMAKWDMVPWVMVVEPRRLGLAELFNMVLVGQHDQKHLVWIEMVVFVSLPLFVGDLELQVRLPVVAQHLL